MVTLTLVAIAYLLVGLFWTGFMYMEVAPLGNWKEHATFWPSNIFFWPVILIIIAVSVVAGLMD